MRASIRSNATLFDLVLRMRAGDVEVFLVARSEESPLVLDDLKGWISKKRIADSLIASVTLFAE